MHRISPTTNKRSRIRPKIIVAGAAVAVTAALGASLAVWAGSSSATSTTNPTPSAHPSTQNPAVPVKPAVVPAGPVKPAVVPAVPVKPAVVPAGPVKPAVVPAGPVKPAVVPAVPVKPAVVPALPAKSTVIPAAALGTYSHGLYSDEMTMVNNTGQTLTFYNNDTDSWVSSPGHWAQRPPQTLAPGQSAVVSGYSDFAGLTIQVAFQVANTQEYVVFLTDVNTIFANDIGGGYATGFFQGNPNWGPASCPDVTGSAGSGYHITSTVTADACPAAG
jgi:hypothetical protein